MAHRQQLLRITVAEADRAVLMAAHQAPTLVQVALMEEVAEPSAPAARSPAAQEQSE